MSRLEWVSVLPSIHSTVIALPPRPGGSRGTRLAFSLLSLVLTSGPSPQSSDAPLPMLPFIWASYLSYFPLCFTENFGENKEWRFLARISLSSWLLVSMLLYLFFTGSASMMTLVGKSSLERLYNYYQT